MPCRAGTPGADAGALREDAAHGASGVSLAHRRREASSPTIRAEWRVECPTRAACGCRVAGDACAPPLMAQWRAGRTVRMPATLREPTVYLRSRRARRAAGAGAARHRAGRDRQERGARRGRRPGLARVGTSGRVSRRGPRGVLRGDRRPLERAVGGCRRRDFHWRSDRARAGTTSAAAGGGHLSRHRDLGRQHRDPDRLISLVALRWLGLPPRAAALATVVAAPGSTDW